MAIPQYGGTNGVPELDLGQVGSARRGGGSAYATLHVLGATDKSTAVEQALVQQNVVFRDELGFRPGQRAWEGWLRAINDDTLEAIFSDINRFLHGSARTAGVLGPPDTAYLRPTRITDYFGNVVSEQARLADWSLTSRVFKLHNGVNGMTLMVGFRIVFLLIG